MKTLLTLMMIMTTYAFGSTNLEGNYFGHVKYEGKKRQVGLLLNKVEEEKDSYYAVLAEYLMPLREKNFVADFLRPGKKKIFSKKENGYLQELFQWIRIYKMVKNEHSNTFEMQKLVVENGKVVALKDSDDTTVILSDTKSKKNPLKGAVVTTSINGKVMAISINSLKRFPLKTTWEKKYVPGPYNPGYKQADIKVLDLKRGAKVATFSVDELKGKALNIHGVFKVNEVHKGMFTFTDIGFVAASNSALVQDKIGVFIDVYNAQPVMNTVELVLIDPADPYNSQMYFEEYGNEDEK